MSFRAVGAALSLALAVLGWGQPAGPGELAKALIGQWVGVLEYRDFSEPAGSAKRVKLPTWLTIESAGGTRLTWRFVYDDGPAKTVKEVETVGVDEAGARYRIFGEDGKVKDTFTIEGLAALRAGRGTVTLLGTGTDNGAAVAVRTTMRVGRNILEITRETGPAGAPLAFRHSYTMVRALAP